MKKRDVRRVDRQGLKLSVGDKIRVSGIPPDVRSGIYDEDEELKTRTVFERSLGRIFPVKAFDDDRVELHVGKVMSRPAYEHSIWLEPQFIELVTRSKSQRGKVTNKRSGVRRVLK
jgi:hypothetical protein